MATLWMTRGLPASGKSTWAKTQLSTHRAGDVIRVNKDLLREMLHDGAHKGKTESQVIAARDAIIVAHLSAGVSVIVDDTNLNPVHEHRLRVLAEEHQATFVVKDFTQIDLDECIKRDAARSDAVGRGVIIKMYEQWLKPSPAELLAVPDEAQSIVIVDVDGTVALMNERSPYDWGAVGRDIPNQPVIEIVRALEAAGHAIVFVSGRDGSCREATRAWLIDHVVPDFELHMRAAGDGRKDSIVKRELFDQHISGRYRVLGVLDDRDQVVRMWREELGLTCLQVAPGAF